MARRSPRTVEPTLNVHLARILRQQHLLVEAERRVSVGSGSIQIDGFLFRDTDAIVIEAELEPAQSVRADAQARLGQTLDGKVVTLAVALIYPDALRSIPDAQLEAELSRRNDLRFSVGELRESNTLLLNDPRNVRWTSEMTGGVRDLADLLWDKWTESSGDRDELNELVSVLDNHINIAAEVIYQSQGTRGRVIDELQLNALGLEEHAATRAAALILVDAMVFHELLSRHIPEIPTPPARAASRDQLANSWERILEINWHPIFAPACRALQQCDAATAQTIIGHLRPAAIRLAASNITARHDLAGRVFHRLLIGGKYLSPNYTTIPAGIILAALALEGLNVDWANSDQIRNLSIVDPACGTGTLLVAASQEIRHRHIRARLDIGKPPSATHCSPNPRHQSIPDAPFRRSFVAYAPGCLAWQSRFPFVKSLCATLP